jgi:hypothetical protein
MTWLTDLIFPCVQLTHKKTPHDGMISMIACNAILNNKNKNSNKPNIGLFWWWLFEADSPRSDMMD